MGKHNRTMQSQHSLMSELAAALKTSAGVEAQQRAEIRHLAERLQDVLAGKSMKPDESALFRAVCAYLAER